MTGHRGSTLSSCRGHDPLAQHYFRRLCPEIWLGIGSPQFPHAVDNSPQVHEIVESYFWGAIITPWALLGEASRRRAQGCNSSYIEEWIDRALSRPGWQMSLIYCFFGTFPWANTSLVLSKRVFVLGTSHQKPNQLNWNNLNNWQNCRSISAEIESTS